MTEDQPPEKSALTESVADRHRLRRESVKIESYAAEHFARHRRDIFFAAVQTTRMPMIVTDPRQTDNPIVFANEAFLRMTGYAADEIIGANCRFLQGPETDAQSLAELRAAISERREHATEILNYRKDGYSFWNALFVSPIYDDHGELIYYFGSQLDVTRRREAEEALRQAQKMEALGRLTGGIAHDFNNLLQVMVGYLDLIDSGFRKSDPDFPKLQRNVANARGAAERASNLTQQLLAFSRKQRLEGRTINLNDLVASIRELADRTLGDEVAIEMKLDRALSNCRVDPTQVETALLNILINARDAMQARPTKRVRIETKDVIVDQEHIGSHHNLPAGRYCTIAIGDSGTGIPSEIVERVMDPFFTTKEEGQGTGLGLSMVYGFAKQSGGRAHIESVEGEGTVVSIYFPAVQDQATVPALPRRGHAIDRPGEETVLIVEDRLDVAELARTILEDLGYKTRHARDAKTALERLAIDDTIDLLFSDLVMPGEMNGAALAREAKRRWPRLKVLLTTGYAEASQERAGAGGAEFDILNKPYGRSTLARKVRVVLDGPTGIS